jgi:methylenetetrahydrofolate dehydrogenase (NADP+)/methenyltetrahydrofolate cyclohydrolase
MTIQTRIIDGKAIAQRQRGMLKTLVQQLYKKHGLIPGLGVVLVGNDPASEVYVRNKVNASREAGINSFERRLPADISEQDLILEVQSLNASTDVHGMLIQLPLPPHINESNIIAAISPEKDVDGFQPVNVGRMWLGEEALLPCTPSGCLMLIRDCVDTLAGKHAVVIGRSNIVGKPMAALLLRENCTVTLAHSKTENLPDLVRTADIVVSAVGKPEMVRGDWIKAGAVVIDVGINRVAQEDGSTKLIGDVAFDECLGIASAITPVPGGVGPMTIACLLQNTVKAAVAITERLHTTESVKQADLKA